MKHAVMIGAAMRSFVCVVLLLLSTSSATAGTTAKGQVEQFYAWYMTRMVADDPPLLDADFGNLKKFVSAGRLAKIKRQMNSADGLSADYFMQSQDYLDSWPEHIAVTMMKDEPKRPQFKVILGLGTEVQKLIVHMVKEGGTWKVDEIGVCAK